PLVPKNILDNSFCHFSIFMICDVTFHRFIFFLVILLNSFQVANCRNKFLGVEKQRTWKLTVSKILTSLAAVHIEIPSVEKNWFIRDEKIEEYTRIIGN